MAQLYTVELPTELTVFPLLLSVGHPGHTYGPPRVSVTGITVLVTMGVNPLGTGGTCPPKVCVGGDTSCIVPPKVE